MVDRPTPQDGPAPRRDDPGVRPYRFRMEPPKPQPRPATAEREQVSRIAATMRELAPDVPEVIAESIAYESLHPVDAGLPTTEQLGLWVQDEKPAHTTACVPEARVRQAAAERQAVKIAQANMPRHGDYAGQTQTMKAGNA